MKTFSILLMIGLFTGQLSFGTGNETCNPDTNTAECILVTQLDQLQAQSLQMTPSLPSLQAKVDQKFTKENLIFSQVQFESELSNVELSQMHVHQLELELGRKLATISTEASSEQVSKF
jgi:hypothetical protein